MVNGISRSRWEFIPSVYFENKPKQMTLELKRLYVTQAKVNSTFRIRPDELFPKKIQYQGKDITILGTEYDNKGVLHLKVQPDENGYNPWASALLTYEPYFLKLQGMDTENTLKHNGVTLDTPETKAISLTSKQLDERYVNVPGYTFNTSLGYMFDNMNRWDEWDKKKKVYDMAIIAPKLDEYEISVRRYNAPIEVNQKIKFTIPPLAEEHNHVGSLTEPKYSKTVNELESSILDQAKQAIQEVAGHDVELYGVEEFKGKFYHDVTVYSKDHKSRVALDLKQGTSDVSLSMSYEELPAEVKRAVEVETGLSGQQIAPRVQEVTRTRARDEREVYTAITGKGFEIELAGNRFTQMGYDIPLDQVNAKALDTAKQAALTVMGKSVPLVKADRSYDYDPVNGKSRDILRFEDEKDDLSIEVGFTSGRLLDVYASGILETGTDATEGIFRKFTDKQVFEAAAPDVKKLFGIDLDGYSVERLHGQNWYTFKKEGSPTIEGEMNRYMKFYRLEFDRDNNGNVN